MVKEYNASGKSLVIDSITELASSTPVVSRNIKNVADAQYIKKNYNALLEKVNGLFEDNLLTPSEKIILASLFNSISSSYSALTSKAEDLGITNQNIYKNYDTAFSNLEDSISPVLAEMDKPSDISGIVPSLSTLFSDYYEKEKLLEIDLFKYTTGLLDGLDDRTKFSMSIISSSGIALNSQSGSTTLSVKLIKEMTDDVTNIYPATAFSWSRMESGWTREGETGKSLIITESDLQNGFGTFLCRFYYEYEAGLFYKENAFATVHKTVKGDKGSPADYLELDVSNTALTAGQESVITTNGTGTITTTITANGSTIPYAKISKITPFHMGHQPIILKNLVIGSSVDWVNNNPGQYGVTIGSVANDWQADHKYYHRAEFKYTTTDQTPKVIRYYSRNGHMGTKGISNPIAGTVYSNSIIVSTDRFLNERQQKVFSESAADINGVTTYGRKALVIDLTESPDLLEALAIIGITTDGQIKAWLDEHIPWFSTDKPFEIGGYITNLQTGQVYIHAFCTATDIADGVRVSITPNEKNSYRCFHASFPYKNNYIYKRVAIAYVSGQQLEAICAPEGGGWNYDANGNYGYFLLPTDGSKTLKYSLGKVNNETSPLGFYDFYAKRTTAITTTSLVFDITNSVAVNISANGVYAFVSLLGYSVLKEIAVWLNTYMPYFKGVKSLSELLPSSLLVTATSTNGLVKHSTISYVEDGATGLQGPPGPAGNPLAIGIYINSNSLISGAFDNNRVFGGSQFGYVIYNNSQVKVQFPLASNSLYINTTSLGSINWGRGFVAVQNNNTEKTVIPVRIVPQENSITWCLYSDSVGTSLANISCIIGSFLPSGEVSLYGVGKTPSEVISSSFLEILGDNADMTTATVWAKALGVERIFQKVAVLEAFINTLFANEIRIQASGLIKSNNFTSVGIGDNEIPTAGFEFRAINGLLFACKARLDSVQITGESTFNGKIINPFFETRGAGKNSVTIKMTSEQNWWSASILYDLFTNAPENTFKALSGSNSIDENSVVNVIRYKSSGNPIIMKAAEALAAVNQTKIYTWTSPFTGKVYVSWDGPSYEDSETEGEWTETISSGSGGFPPENETPPSNPHDGDSYVTYTDILQKHGNPPWYIYTVVSHVYHETTTTYSVQSLCTLKKGSSNLRQSKQEYQYPVSVNKGDVLTLTTAPISRGDAGSWDIITKFKNGDEAQNVAGLVFVESSGTLRFYPKNSWHRIAFSFATPSVSNTSIGDRQYSLTSNFSNLTTFTLNMPYEIVSGTINGYTVKSFIKISDTEAKINYLSGKDLITLTVSGESRTSFSVATTLKTSETPGGITTGTILPQNNDTQNIGSERLYFKNVYAKKVYGAVANPG